MSTIVSVSNFLFLLVINWLNKQMNDQMVTQQRYGPFEMHSKFSTRDAGRVRLVTREAKRSHCSCAVAVVWSGSTVDVLRACCCSMALGMPDGQRVIPLLGRFLNPKQA